MTITELYNSIKSYLAGFLTFVVFFSASGVFLWSEYKEIQTAKAGISKQAIALKDSELEFERDKSSRELKFKEQEFDLKIKADKVGRLKNELEIERKQLKDTLESKSAEDNQSIVEKQDELSSLINAHSEKLKEANQLRELYSKEARKSKAEDLIFSAMAEFSKLGVDISLPDWCDKEYMKRYYQAEALIDKISALNGEYDISSSYEGFINSHRRSSWSSTDGACQENSVTEVPNSQPHNTPLRYQALD